MLGGRLPETENKRMCVISGLKRGRGPSKFNHSTYIIVIIITRV